MFVVNNTTWNLIFVNPRSEHLKTSLNTYVLGVTDWNDKCVYVADNLYGDKLEHVVCHEIVHCFMFSYSMYLPIEEEEYIANWVADYGRELFYILDDILYSMNRRIA